MMELPHFPGRAGAPRVARRILLIDDNDDARDLMALALELRGHVVATADGGSAGLARAAAFGPDIVFLDLGMPVMDGYETAVKLRRLAGLAQPCIVALSGWSDQATLARTQNAGFDYHVGKPADLARIDDFLQGDWMPRPGASPL